MLKPHTCMTYMTYMTYKHAETTCLASRFIRHWATDKQPIEASPHRKRPCLRIEKTSELLINCRQEAPLVSFPSASSGFFFLGWAAANLLFSVSRLRADVKKMSRNKDMRTSGQKVAPFPRSCCPKTDSSCHSSIFLVQLLAHCSIKNINVSREDVSGTQTALQKPRIGVSHPSEAKNRFGTL